MRGAAEELRSVLQASPDNLMAGRLLAEFQEALEDFAGAAETYAQLIPLAPGDKQLEARLADARERAARSVPSPQVGSAEMQDRFAPIPLAEVADEAFEVERSGEADPFREPTGPAPAPAAPPASAAPAPPAGEELVFEFEPSAETLAFQPHFRPLEEDAPPRAVAATPLPVPATRPTSPALASPTLAELYQQQGATDLAIETYKEVLLREPDNPKARQRLAELESAGSQPVAPSRRAALERTIQRLEALALAFQGSRG